MEPTPSENFPDIPDGTATELFDIDEEVEIQPQRLGFWKTCLRYFRLFLQMLFSYVGLTAILVGYLLLGAVVFGAIEAPVEERIRNEIKKKKTQFFFEFYEKSNELSMQNWTNTALIELTQIERSAKAHYYIFDEEGNEKGLKWSFFGSMLFSLTVVSTIGYGHIAPVTPVGQVFCIVYALVGLPLMLLVLTNVGRVMANVARVLYIVYTSRLCRKLRKNCKKKTKKKKRRKKKLKKKHKRKARLKEGERVNRPRSNAPKKEKRNSNIKKTPSQATIRVDAGPYREGRPMSVNMELMRTEPPFPPSYSESKDLGGKLGDSMSDRVSIRDRLSDRLSRSSDKFSSDKASSSDKISSVVSSEKISDKISDKVPSDKVSNKVPSDKVSNKVPPDKVSEKIPSDKVSNKVPSDKVSDKVPSDKVSNKFPSDKVSDKVPSDKVSNKFPSDKVSDKAPSDKVSDKALSDKLSDKAPSDKMFDQVPSEKDKTSEREVKGMFTEDPPKENLDGASPVPTTPVMFKCPRAFDDEDYDIGDFSDDDDDDDDEFLMANDDIPPDYAPPPPPPGVAPYELSDVEMLDIRGDYDDMNEEPETAQVTATSESDRDTDADVTTPLVRHVSLRESRSSDRIRKPILRTGSSLEFGEYHRQKLQKRQKSCMDFREFDQQSLAPPDMKEVVIVEEPDVYRLTIPEEEPATENYSLSESANESAGGRRRKYRKGKKPRKRRVTKEERKAAARAIKERKKMAKEKAKMAAQERAYMIRQRRIEDRQRKSSSKRKRPFLVRRPIMAPPTLRALHHSRQLKLLDSSLAVRLSTHNKSLGNSREDITSSVKGLRTEKLNLLCEYDNGKVRVSPTLKRRVSTRSKYSTRSKWSERSKYSDYSEYSSKSGYSGKMSSMSGSKMSSMSSSSSRSGSRRRKRRKGKGSVSPPDSNAPSCSEGRESDNESIQEEETQRELTTADIPIGPVLVFFFGYIGAGAILFSLLEKKWTLFESFYFCFITLTTIGFGDFVPDNSMESLIACCLYTMIGMAVTSMCIALMMKKFVVTIQNIGKKVGIIEADPEGPS